MTILLKWVPVAVLVLVLLVGVVVGALAYADNVRTLLPIGRHHIVHPELRATMARLAQDLPATTAIAFASKKAGVAWSCGQWQRELYPRPVFCLLTPEDTWPSKLLMLRGAYGVEHLIIDGAVPASITLVNRRRLSRDLVLGELAR